MFTFIGATIFLIGICASKKPHLPLITEINLNQLEPPDIKTCAKHAHSTVNIFDCENRVKNLTRNCYQTDNANSVECDEMKEFVRTGFDGMFAMDLQDLGILKDLKKQCRAACKEENIQCGGKKSKTNIDSWPLPCQTLHQQEINLGVQNKPKKASSWTIQPPCSYFQKIKISDTAEDSCGEYSRYDRCQQARNLLSEYEDNCESSGKADYQSCLIAFELSQYLPEPPSKKPKIPKSQRISKKDKNKTGDKMAKSLDENGRPVSGRNIGPDYVKNNYQLLEDNILGSRTNGKQACLKSTTYMSSMNYCNRLGEFIHLGLDESLIPECEKLVCDLEKFYLVCQASSENYGGRGQKEDCYDFKNARVSFKSFKRRATKAVGLIKGSGEKKKKKEKNKDKKTHDENGENQASTSPSKNNIEICPIFNGEELDFSDVFITPTKKPLATEKTNEPILSIQPVIENNNNIKLKKQRWDNYFRKQNWTVVYGDLLGDPLDLPEQLQRNVQQESRKKNYADWVYDDSKNKHKITLPSQYTDDRASVVYWKAIEWPDKKADYAYYDASQNCRKQVKMHLKNLGIDKNSPHHYSYRTDSEKSEDSDYIYQYYYENDIPEADYPEFDIKNGLPSYLAVFKNYEEQQAFLQWKYEKLTKWRYMLGGQLEVPEDSRKPYYWNTGIRSANGPVVYYDGDPIWRNPSTIQFIKEHYLQIHKQFNPTVYGESGKHRLFGKLCIGIGRTTEVEVGVDVSELPTDELFDGGIHNFRCIPDYCLKSDWNDGPYCSERSHMGYVCEARIYF